MREAIGAGDPDRLKCAAHTLQGALGYLGARVPIELALELETSGANADCAVALAGVATLEEEMVHLKKSLATFLERNAH
jgi:HPt (histidine-containing phosphotransfer) domain-containing protein